MRAAVHTRYGPPEVVRVIDVDEPEPAAGELLVRVRATSVNRTDCGFRAATPFIVRAFAGLTKPRRTILGNEFAGVVEEVGDGVTTFAVGDRVFGYNEGPFGCHAELVVVAADGPVAQMSTDATFLQAATATEGAHYALAFVRRAGVAEGQDVLVYGATGAIGSAAVQLVKHLGARVTAVCGPAHLELVEGLGADRVLDHTTEDYAADDVRYDVVLDAVGKSSWARAKRVLKPRGVYLSSELGAKAQNPLLALVTPLFRGRRVLFAVPGQDQAMIEYLKDLMETGAFTPVIDRTYPLDEIVDAYRYVETGEKIGNVVITIGADAGAD